MITVEVCEEVHYAFTTKEKALVTAWYPVVWPYKAIVAYGLVLLLIQGIFNTAKDLMALLNKRKHT
jgi:TRAP-type mannitol/chloroaromatic compound transport system permease small subunit